MKRSILALFLCVALLLTACGNTNSSSDKPSPEDALMAQLEGMYVAKEGINLVYYLFHNGEVYFAKMTDFSNEVTRILDSNLNSYGVSSWKSMDFEDILDLLDPMNVFFPESAVRVDAASNSVILREGNRDEKMVTLSDEGVTIRETNAIGVAPVALEKLANHADFSGEKFEAAFKAAKERCTAPASMFWVKPSHYAEQIMQLHPEIKAWDQLSEEVYHQNSPIKGVSSSFVVTSSSITLVMGRNDNTDVTAFMVNYTPGSSGSQIAISSRMGYGLEELMKYVEIALGGFPGELTAKEISRRIGSRYSPNGALNLEVTVEYLDFHFVRSSESLTSTIVLVEADQVSLAPLLADNQDTTIPTDPKPSTPSDTPVDPEPSTPTDTNTTTPTNPRPTTPPETPTEPKPTTPPSTPVEPEPTVPPCSHSYSAATCTKPKTCTLCGQTEGSALGHSYTAATCTTPKTCTRCGNTTGKAAGHSWKEATCTTPATCTSCQKTSGEPAGHSMLYTKCEVCGTSDFSCLSQQPYSIKACYDSKTGESYDVENVSISDTGVLTFTFKEVTYSLALKQTTGDYWEVYFDCYQNGILEPDAEARAVQSYSAGVVFHFKWEYLDGCNLYFYLKA